MPDQLSLLIRVAEEEAEEGGRRRHWGGGNILKPFLFRSSIIFAILCLAACSIEEKNCFYWSFGHFGMLRTIKTWFTVVFRPSLFLLNARCSIDLAGGTRGLLGIIRIRRKRCKFPIIPPPAADCNLTYLK